MMRQFKNPRIVAATVTAWSILQFVMAPVSAELLLFYDFNNAADPTVAVDVSGKGNDADVFDAEYTAAGGGRTGAADDRAMDFLSHADPAYIEVSTAPDGALDSITDNDAATITLWLYGADENPVNGTVVWWAGSNQRQMVIHVPWSDEIIYFDMAGCDSCLFMQEPDESKYKGEWNHYAFVKDGEQAAIYQNGDLWIETVGRDPYSDITTARFGTFAGSSFPYAGLMDEIGVWNEALTAERIRDIMANGLAPPTTRLQAGDADQDLDFDQLDLVKVQIAAKYLTAQAATWGEGDWDGAPGGSVGNPPPGNQRFDQLDIISALTAGKYLTGPYGAVRQGGSPGDGQTSVGYNPATGELFVDAPAGVQLTSINIDSAARVFTGDPAMNLGGSFDNDADGNIFKATFGSSFGSLSFGRVAQPGLTEAFVLGDLSVVGSLAGGGALGDVDLIYVPEPSSAVLLVLAALALPVWYRRPTLCRAWLR
jgi:hypothetical protein